jgi:AAA family ATP:ADP antiporter
VAWAALLGFLLLASYNLVRPLRDEVGARLGVDAVPWLMTATLGAMLLATPVVGWAMARLPRARRVPVLYRAFALIFVALGVLLAPGLGAQADAEPGAPVADIPARWTTGVGAALFVWTGVFNLLSVALFWAFLADVYPEEKARRLFPLVGVGATLGAIAGSALPALLAHVLPAPALVLGAAALLEVAVRVQRRTVGVAATFDGEGSADAARGAGARVAAGGDVRGRASKEAHQAAPDPQRLRALEGLRRIARSRYLLGVCAYMLLFSATSSVLHLEQIRVVGVAFDTPEARTAAFARIDLLVNIATLVAQLFLAGRLIRAAGVRGALLATPALTLLGLGALALAPAYTTLVLVQTLRRGTHFAVDRPCREVLFTVLGPAEKYQSKPFIDTFVYRAGDLVGAWGGAWLISLGPLALLGAAPVAIAWGVVAWGLGGAHARRARARAPTIGAAPDATGVAATPVLLEPRGA